MARLMLERFDDYLANLSSRDMVGGVTDQLAVDALGLARDLWSRGSKAQVIENIIEDANLRASAGYSQSGVENALRTGFKNLALNRTKMRAFSAEEQAAIRAVAQGGPLANAARFLGKWAPRGPVASAMTGALGGAVGGVPGAMAGMAVGETARQVATGMTQSRAQRALEMMLQQRVVPPNVSSPALPFAAAGAGQQTVRGFGVGLPRETDKRYGKR